MNLTNFPHAPYDFGRLAFARKSEKVRRREQLGSLSGSQLHVTPLLLQYVHSRGDKK